VSERGRAEEEITKAVQEMIDKWYKPFSKSLEEAGFVTGGKNILDEFWHYGRVFKLSEVVVKVGGLVYYLCGMILERDAVAKKYGQPGLISAILEKQVASSMLTTRIDVFCFEKPLVEWYKVIVSVAPFTTSPYVTLVVTRAVPTSVWNKGAVVERLNIDGISSIFYTSALNDQYVVLTMRAFIPADVVNRDPKSTKPAEEAVKKVLSEFVRRVDNLCGVEDLD